MQLQGELHARGEVKKVYTGLFQGLRTIAKSEGLASCQRGLVAAVSLISDILNQVIYGNCRLTSMYISSA